MLYEKLFPDFDFEDERGRLVQLVHMGYTQVNVITSKAGAMRGNHYHRRSTEAFYVVSGSVVVTLEWNKNREEVIFKSGNFFQIQPGIIHSMLYPEDTTLIALYDLPIEQKDGKKDIFPGL